MADAAKAKDDKKTRTPKFRASFPWLFKPQPPMKGSENQEAKYSVVMLFDKEAQASPLFAEMRRIARQAAAEKWGANSIPKNLRNPFRSGEEKADLEGYGPGVIFVTASTKQIPGLINGRKEKITEASGEFYAGCYAHATVTAYAYERAGNKGVAFGLHNVQKLGDGPAFSNRAKAEEEFEATEESFMGDSAAAGLDFLA